MPITRLQINCLRNLSSIHLDATPAFNVFYGQNGSGKTSLLEAIYYLGLGRSFRTHLTNRIIQNGENSFSIFAQLQETGATTPIGIERYIDGSRKLRINQEDVSSIATLAKKLPIQFISTTSYQIFHEGPKLRRQYMDWGLFHVKQTFYPLWQQLQKALKQRNAALKNKAKPSEIKIWDHELVSAATEIDKLREIYINKLQQELTPLLNTFIPTQPLVLRYSRGWPKGGDLNSLLSNNFKKDLLQGYTQYGPHRADLQLYTEKVPAQDHLSQGQQKLASYALYLAQGILARKETGKSPIYLIDDLPSELDPEKRERITKILLDLKAQVFITGITLHDLAEVLNLPNTSLFHVKQGGITSVEGILIPT